MPSGRGQDMEFSLKHAVLIMAGMALSLMTLSMALADTKPEAGPVPSLDYAKGLIEAERYEQAVAVLKQLDDGSDGAAAQISLLFGRIYLSIGKPAKALDFFEQASYASLDTEAEAYLGLGEAELALGDLTKARKDAAIALKADPDLVAAHLVLARADQRIGRADLAMARLRQLQQDRPDSEDVVVVLARYLAQQGNPAAGVTELQRFVDRHSNAAQAWDAMGLMAWAVGRKPVAVEARTTAQRLYRERGQTGRAEVIALWLRAVEGQLPPQSPSTPSTPSSPSSQPPAPPPPPSPAQPDAIVPPPQILQPPVGDSSPNQEPPKPTAAPQPKVQAAPLPPRKITQAVALPHPEPLPFAQGAQLMTGSGIVMEGGRQIVTNRHVIEGMSVIAVRNGTGHVRMARVVKTSAEDDLALLEIDRPFPDGAVMPLADIVEPPPGREAVVMGFPMINLFGDEQPSLTEGIVAKSAGLGNDPNTFQITAKINKGNSGGPVFDRRGHLMGVAVGKVDSNDIYQKSGIRVEDINLGIKGGRILRFLGKPAAPESHPAEMSLEDIYQQMLPRTVLVAAQR